jgi:hypothetical protein
VRDRSADRKETLDVNLRSRFLFAGLIALLAVTTSPGSRAGPWVEPGDLRLRHDVQSLADAGLIRSPVSTWPNSWPQIAREVLGLEAGSVPDRVAASFARVSSRARTEMRTGRIALSGRAAAAEKPTPLRTFDDTPREQGEIAATASFTGERFAWRAAATLVADPSDGKTLRPDGSYLGVVLGNWIVSAGYLEQWWGPGWEGSLILGNNARPIPSISIDRNYADAFETPWLSWIGPWRLSFRIGQLEGDRDDFPDTRFFAMRVNFRPLESLEIGVSRSAQFCGEGRPCGFRQFWDLFIGNDNDQPLENQPGNQMAGFDARWTLPFDFLPLAVYGQLIGEDEAGFLPSKYLGLFGLEAWGSAGAGHWRAHLEYADTTCSFNRQDPQYACAYNNQIYTDGYTYRDRGIGHAMGGDSRMWSLGTLYVGRSGTTWNVLARSVELNRAGASGSHPIASVPVDLVNLELSTTREYDFGTMRLGLGYDWIDESPAFEGGDEFRGFVEWRHAF